VSVVVVVIPVVLSGLSDNSSNTRPRCPADDRALQATAEHCSQRRPTSRANQRSLSGANAALILIPVVIVVIVSVVIVVVVAATTAAAHAVIVGTVVMVLGVRGNEADREQERSKDRFS